MKLKKEDIIKEGEEIKARKINVKRLKREMKRLEKSYKKLDEDRKIDWNKMNLHIDI